MSLLWIIVGLIVLVVGLLILNLWVLRNNRAIVKRRDAVATADREATFQKNCKVFGLSARESDVLRLILVGYTYRQTAERLFISEKTVDSHLQNAYRKIGERNKIALYHKLYTE